MQSLSDVVKTFFEQYEDNLARRDPAGIASQYGESFVFAGPDRAQALGQDVFLKALPKRQELFTSVGLRSSRIRALEEARFDNSCVMVKAQWRMHFEPASAPSADVDVSATYLLHQRPDGLRIVFQLDHDDLHQRVQELGLLPASLT